MNDDRIGDGGGTQPMSTKDRLGRAAAIVGIILGAIAFVTGIIGAWQSF